MRKGVDGLSGVIQQDFNQNALSGDVFIFLNQNRNRIKLLHWQGDGFAIYYKRLERGTFEIPQADPANKAITLTHHQLQFILDGIVLINKTSSLKITDLHYFVCEFLFIHLAFHPSNYIWI